MKNFYPRSFSGPVAYYASAILLALAFPKADLWPLAWIALVPWMKAMDGKGARQCFRIGYLTGFAFFALMLYWLVFVTWLGAVLFFLYMALYFGIFALAYGWAFRRGIWEKLLWLPCVWVGLEYVRAHFLSGFGWLSLGHSQSKNLAFVQSADIVGVYGISFLVVLINVFVKEAWAAAGPLAPAAAQTPAVLAPAGARRKLWAAGAFVIVLFITNYGYGFFRLSQRAEGPSVRVAVVQGNVPHVRRWIPNFWPYILRDYMALTEKVVAEKPHLIVWPESAYPGIPSEAPQMYARFIDKAKALKVPLLTGIVTQDGVDYYNAAYLFSDGKAPSAKYHKIHLVPFGEFIPLRRALPFLSKIVPIDDFTPGKDWTVFEARGLETTGLKIKGRYSVLICFEDTIPELAREFAKRGAQFFVNISNDAWFEDTNEPYLHLANAAFRAIENRRVLVRCGNVGVSGFVDTRGRTYGMVKNAQGKQTYVEGFSVADAGLNDEATFYTKFGDVFTLICFSGILMGVMGFSNSIKQRRETSWKRNP